MNDVACLETICVISGEPRVADLKMWYGQKMLAQNYIPIYFAMQSHEDLSLLPAVVWHES